MGPPTAACQGQGIHLVQQVQHQKLHKKLRKVYKSLRVLNENLQLLKIPLEAPNSLASGVTWPTMMPWEAPLKRPSVTRATYLPSPAPTKAEPGLSICERNCTAEIDPRSQIPQSSPPAFQEIPLDLHSESPRHPWRSGETSTPSSDGKSTMPTSPQAVAPFWIFPAIIAPNAAS